MLNCAGHGARPEVRAICQRNDVAYKNASWPATLKNALSRVARLSKPSWKITGVSEVLRSVA